MERQELLHSLKEGQIILTTGKQLAESSMTPFNEDNIIEYIVEISLTRNGHSLLVNFIHESEPASHHHHYDYGQDYYNEIEIAKIIDEMLDNHSIFSIKINNK